MATKMELWIALHGTISFIDYEGEDPEEFVSSNYPSDCEWGVFKGIEDRRKKKQIFNEFDLMVERVGGWRNGRDYNHELEDTLYYITEEWNLTNEQKKKLFEASEDGFTWDIEKDEVVKECSLCDNFCEQSEDICQKCRVPLCDRTKGDKCKQCDNICVDEEDSLCHACYHKDEGILCYCWDGDCYRWGTDGRPMCDCGKPVRVRTLPTEFFEKCWDCENPSHPPYYCDGGCGKIMGDGHDHDCKRVCDFCETPYEDDNPVDPIQCPISGP